MIKYTVRLADEDFFLFSGTSDVSNLMHLNTKELLAQLECLGIKHTLDKIVVQEVGKTLRFDKTIRYEPYLKD